MKNKFLSTVLLISMFYSPSWAHHSFAVEFDETKPVTLTGIVTKLDWVNPHVWIHVKVSDNLNQEWMIEGGTPNALKRKGIKKETFSVGTKLVVRGFQSRGLKCSPKCRVSGRDITTPDGIKINLSAGKDE